MPSARRTPIFAANWKMHLGPDDARAYMRDFIEATAAASDRTLVFFPPSLSLAAAREAAAARPDLDFGVQNIHWEEKGAFTGEVSAPMARQAGASMVLVGHSERRHVFGERDEECGRKVAAAARAGLLPILCVGEKLNEREAGGTEAVVLRQLRAGLLDLPAGEARPFVIAYEPVWAIGTGRTATPEDASTVHAAIRRHLRQSRGEAAAEVPILYGGSVNDRNAASLLAAAGVDGLLVGGASLDPVSWARITRT